MSKIYVLDTNVLVHSSDSLFSFEENEVVIPFIVLEELDSLKKEKGEVGFNAREVGRVLDDLREKGDLSSGVELENGGSLRVADPIKKIYDLDDAIKDNRIIATALSLNEERDEQVILVSQDRFVRIKADVLDGLKVENYKSDSVPLDTLYTGLITKQVSSEIIDKIYNNNDVSLDDLDVDNLESNGFLNLNTSTSQSSVLYFKNDKLTSLNQNDYRKSVYYIKARNREQTCAFKLLMDRDVELVTLVGKAGTGKTLLALASALQQVIEEQHYQKIIVARPPLSVGEEIGFLPGNEREKLDPWMQPIWDNLELIFRKKVQKDKSGDLVSGKVAQLEKDDKLEVGSLSHIRGRSIPDQFIIIDEAQNLTPHEVKTVVTRAGEGTKIVLTGDPYQIDHPYLDSQSNGLTHLVEKMKKRPIVGHITLTKGERSRLAEAATQDL